MARTQEHKARTKQNGRGIVPEATPLPIEQQVHTNGSAIGDIADTAYDRTSNHRQKVIKFSNVSKRFTLHHEKARSFQDMVVSLFGLRTLSKRGVALPRPVKEDFWALRDVNFGVYEGEAIGIIGENGSGNGTNHHLYRRRKQRGRVFIITVK